MTSRAKETRPRWNGAGAVLLLAALSLMASRNASATSEFAKETGKPCSQCHQNPKGGAKLTAFGTRFKANGNKMPTAATKDQPTKKHQPAKPAP